MNTLDVDGMKTAVHKFNDGDFVLYRGIEYTIQYQDISNDRQPTYAIQLLKWEGLVRMDEVFILQVKEADLMLVVEEVAVAA